MQVDYQGDGSFVVDSTNAAIPLSYAFDAPGAYLALARVSFDDGDPMTALVMREARYRLQMQSLAFARQTLCGLYYGMKHRLIAGQIPLALNTLGPRIRPKFQTLWNSLGANLATVAARLGQMTVGQISDVSITQRDLPRTTGLILMHHRRKFPLWRKSFALAASCVLMMKRRCKIARRGLHC